jgi:hypothetical protein
MRKKRSTFDLMMAWEGGEISDEETTELFQELVNTGQAWRLQGMYGRQAQALLDAGYIHYPKKHKQVAVGLDSSTDFYGNKIPTQSQHEKLKKKMRSMGVKL